jgi:hypothetical protein
MLVLFINAHKKNEEGTVRFKNFYDNTKAALKTTIYYGNEVVETIRSYDDLSDYIYDEVTFRI